MSSKLRIEWHESTFHTTGESRGSTEREATSLSLDDTLDLFRSALVGMGYSSKLAASLCISQEAGAVVDEAKKRGML